MDKGGAGEGAMNDRPFPDIPGAAMDLLLEYLEASKDIPGVFRLIEFWFQVKGIAPALSSALDAGCGWGGIKAFFLVLLRFVWVNRVYRVIGKRYHPVAQRSHRRPTDGRVVPFHPGAGACEALERC